MDQMVNNIRLTWKLACMVRTYKTYDPTVRFLKYEFNNKLLGNVTLLRVTPYITWTLYITKKKKSKMTISWERNTA